MGAWWALVLAAIAPAVVAEPPSAVSVTVYRDPERGPGDAMSAGWPRGYALVSETRTVTLPAGDSVVRFEGVAGGILPASAIVSGLPGGVVEKNREARLLSPAALIDGSLGRRVHLRRTDRATGRVREEEATVIAGPDSGVVLRTGDGIEALGCAGLPEAPTFDGVPDGLSATPTLTVTTRSAAATGATVTLSYLADAFDWRADYVAQVAADGRTLDLFAWLTLANGNGESFRQASAFVVAGKPARDAGAATPPPAYAPELALRCWPQGTTSDVSEAYPPPPPPPPAPSFGEDIVVTASRRAEALMATPVMVAEQEDLGDLKLYRVPEPVTIAANAQKQVALLTKAKVPFERLYAATLDARGDAEDAPAQRLIRMRNTRERGLGLPLPAGGVAVFEDAGNRPMLAGEARIGDVAVGRDVELALGESAQVRIAQRAVGAEPEQEEMPRRHEITVSNALPEPVTVEVILRRYDERMVIEAPSARLGSKDGRTSWAARVPANGTAKLHYVTRLRR